MIRKLSEKVTNDRKIFKTFIKTILENCKITKILKMQEKTEKFKEFHGNGHFPEMVEQLENLKQPERVGENQYILENSKIPGKSKKTEFSREIFQELLGNAR